MQGYNFTERVRKVLGMAREESIARHHEYVGPEHMLLALIREAEGVAAQVLQNMDVDLEALKERIESIITPGVPSGASSPDLPYTSRAKRVLELSMSAARDLEHSYVGTEHLLLGLLREEKGIAAQVLVGAGLSTESVREETLRLLGTSAPSTRPLAPPGKVTLITIELQMADGTRLRNEFHSAATAMVFLKDL